MNVWTVLDMIADQFDNEPQKVAAKKLIEDQSDDAIDYLEAQVQGKPYEALAMRLLKFIRDTVDIPDEPGEDQANPK